MRNHTATPNTRQSEEQRPNKLFPQSSQKALEPCIICVRAKKTSRKNCPRMLSFPVVPISDATETQSGLCHTTERWSSWRRASIPSRKGPGHVPLRPIYGASRIHREYWQTRERERERQTDRRTRQCRLQCADRSGYLRTWKAQSPQSSEHSLRNPAAIPPSECAHPPSRFAC